MNNINTVLAARVAAIEENSAPSSSEVVIPAVIDNLIDNKMYHNKFKKLIRLGHLNDLLELAALAQRKEQKSHWFARATRTTPIPGREGQPTYWERSLAFLAKLTGPLSAGVGGDLVVDAPEVPPGYRPAKPTRDVRP